MVLVYVRQAPAIVAPGKRRYHDRAERLALTETVAESYAAEGTLGPREVRMLAARSGRSERQARRMLGEWLERREHGPVAPPPALPEDFLRAVAAHHGVVSAAIRDYFGAEDGRQHRASIYRRMHEIDPGLLVALRKGPEAYGRYLEVGVFEPAHRNEVWQIDEMHYPIRCRDEKNRAVDDLWLTSILDTYARLVLAAQVTYGQADELITSALLARAIAGGEWEGIAYGGSAEALGADNAQVYKGDLWHRVLKTGGIEIEYAKPYTPQDKGFIERFHRTLQEMFLSAVPGYTKGPRKFIFLPTGELDRHGRPKRVRAEIHALIPRDPANLLSVDAATQVLYAAILEYNLRHVHRAFGTTPIRRYGEDRRPLRRPGLAALWEFALPLPRDKYIGEHRGVHLDDEYRSGELPLAGRRLQARVLPGFAPRYLIGDELGQFLEEVVRTADKTEVQRAASRARNHARLSLVGRVLGEGAASLEALAAEPGTPAYVSERRAETIAADTAPSLADVDAALAIPEQESVA